MKDAAAAPSSPRLGMPARERPIPPPPSALKNVSAAPPAPFPDTSRHSAGDPRYLVQLGAFSTDSNAFRARTGLAGDLSELLGDGEHMLQVDASKGGGLWRVVLVQAFAERDEAANLCAKIEARKKDCYVTQAW